MSESWQVVIESMTGNEPRTVALQAGETRIGRGADCHIGLPGMLVSDWHASLILDGGLWLENRDPTNPTLINDHRIMRGERIAVQPGDIVRIGNGQYTLRVQRVELESDEVTANRFAIERFAELLSIMHSGVIQRLDRREVKLDDVASERGRVQVVSAVSEEINTLPLDKEDSVRSYAAREALRTAVLARLTPDPFETQAAPPAGAEDESERVALSIPLQNLSERLGISFDPRKWKQQLFAVRRDFDAAYRQVAVTFDRELERRLARYYFRKQIYDLIFSFGPLTDLLRLPDVTEIMVVSRDQIYIEIDGRVEQSGRTFASDEVTERIIERIVRSVDRRIDRSKPIVDARLPDGSRVNAIIPPIALKGPCLTIRRFSREGLTLRTLIAFGSLDERAAHFLRGCVRARKNIMISGGTGCGKTTLLNALSASIEGHERLVTIEDNAELRLQQEHVVPLEARPPNMEGKGAVTIRDLVRNALRMRPDRIIVGECRGAETLDMLQAMNTGHSGSMTTAHANTPTDLIRRLETMTLEAEDLPVIAIRRHIASALDLIVQQSRMMDGTRKVTHITAVAGFDEDDGDVVLEDVFVRRDNGAMIFTGYVPEFLEELVSQGNLRLEEVFG